MYEDGRIYNGEYLNDKKHGHGVYTWPNGKKYDGDWLNDKQHGTAKFSNTKGQTRLGQWENGQRIKWISRDGMTETTSQFNDLNVTQGSAYRKNSYLDGSIV